MKRILDDLTLGVMEEIGDVDDAPLTSKAARYVAACLLVGLVNRGWEWRLRDGYSINVHVDPHLNAATVEQVSEFLRTHRAEPQP